MPDRLSRKRYATDTRTQNKEAKNRVLVGISRSTSLSRLAIFAIAVRLRPEQPRAEVRTRFFFLKLSSVHSCLLAEQTPLTTAPFKRTA